MGNRLASVDQQPSARGIGAKRWSPYRIATHLLASEDESKVTFFDGNFSEYEV